MKRSAARGASLAVTLVAAFGLSACGLPRSGPNKSELLAGAIDAEGDAYVLIVDRRVTAAANVEPTFGFDDWFRGKGVVTSDAIAPGDVLDITVYENVRDAPLLGGVGQGATPLSPSQVDGEGYIFIPYAGRLLAAGQTPEGLRQAITRRLEPQTPDPQVTVTRTPGDGATVSIVGVATQGVFPIERPTRTLSSLIARAGGVGIKPDIAIVRVIRGGRTGTIRLEDLYRDPSQDIALRPGDQIVVEEDSRSFIALGGTGAQARVPFAQRTLTALDALATVGGLNTSLADPTGIFVLRTVEEERARQILGRPDLQGRQRMIFVLNLTEPNGLFEAKEFYVQDQDVLYVTEAPFTQWQKTIAAITGAAGSLNSLQAVVAGTTFPLVFPAGPTRLFPYAAGFLRDRRLRRILALAGHSLHLGLPGPGDGVVVWGQSPHAWRGERVAARRRVPLVRIEDAFLRSLRPGRAGDAPLGLLIDPLGVHFDPATPSRIEDILARNPLDDAVLLARAHDGIARLRHLHLSKYNLHDPALPAPPPGYVLVVDQTAGDASVRASGGDAALFQQMLAAAAEAHPGARILVRAHPETVLGLRAGLMTPALARGLVSLSTDPVSPWALLDGAIAVWTLSSQLGFEAILAGHRPHVWGGPFYAGWGLTQDRLTFPRRRRRLTRAQLFAAAMILSPVWYDPCRDRLCRFEDAVDQMEAEVRAWREDRRGHVATGMRLWKRPRLQAFFGAQRRVIFADPPARAAARAAATGRDLLAWAGSAVPLPPPGAVLRRVEDGFLRSRGLGADLVPPLSLVADTRGIYYDPATPSELELLIRAPLPPGGAARAERLLARLTAAGVTKYNLPGALPDLPQGLRVLVPGQVEDDASIRLGAGEVRTNLALLRAARAARPGAVLIYKPHPDVEAGLRPGAVAAADLAGLADVVATRADPAALIAACDEVWTMTSLLGFEALMRGRRVTCLGAPFYAGWGLTTDLGPVPGRRRRAEDGHPLPRIDLLALVHAALIGYPRYLDPVTHRPCPPEVAVDRLAAASLPPRGAWLRMLAKAQGALAGQAWLWRR